MEDHIPIYLSIIVFPLIFLLGKIIYRGQESKDVCLKETELEKLLSKEESKTFDYYDPSNYWRVQNANGEGVGIYDGWCRTRLGATVRAEMNDLTDDDIYEYSMEEAREKGIPKVIFEAEGNLHDGISKRPFRALNRISRIFIGPRGGRYRINSKGRKSYDVT